MCAEHPPGAMLNMLFALTLHGAAMVIISCNNAQHSKKVW